MFFCPPVLKEALLVRQLKVSWYVGSDAPPPHLPFFYFVSLISFCPFLSLEMDVSRKCTKYFLEKKKNPFFFIEVKRLKKCVTIMLYYRRVPEEEFFMLKDLFT